MRASFLWRGYPVILTTLARHGLAVFLVALVSCAGGAATRVDVTSGPSPAALTAGSILESVPPVTEAGRVLVVFFSAAGATERIARDLADLTGADLEEIREYKDRGAPRGFWGYFTAGARASFGTTPRIVQPVHKPSDYDTVIVCTPVWSWNLAPPVRSWLRTFRGTLSSAMYVTVSGDTNPDKIVRNMAREGGREPLSFAGFSEQDQYAENRDAYVRKIAHLMDPLRGRL